MVKKKTAKKELQKEKGETVVDSEDTQLIPLSTLLILTAYLILNGLFLLLLNQSINSRFNWVDFGIVLVLTLAIVGFLLLVRSVMKTNALEGSIIGFSIIVVAIAALLVKFKGLYTTIFAVLGALIAVLYVSYFYWLEKKKTIAPYS